MNSLEKSVSNEHLEVQTSPMDFRITALAIGVAGLLSGCPGSDSDQVNVTSSHCMDPSRGD